MKDFLVKFLKVYPHIPPQSLWRAIEAKLLYEQSFEEPILDLGCGDGLFASILFEGKSKKIVGCDRSPGCIATAKSASIYEYITISDAHHLPYKDSSFATVLSNCVIEHIPEDEKVLREVCRVLREGGRLIFTVPSENFVGNLKNQDREYVKKFMKRLEHFHCRSPLEWGEILQQCGLILEEFRYYIPKEVQQIWEMLIQFFIKKIIGRELFRFLGSRKLGINFIVRLVFPIVFSRYLRKWYLTGVYNNKEGGALLVVARKLEDSR